MSPQVCCPIACALHAPRVSCGSACARCRWGARCFWQPRKEYHQLADHGRAGLVWSCSALPRSRARPWHVLATCASVHVTPLILSLRAWGGRVGDSQSDGGGQRSCCRFRHLQPPPRCAAACSPAAAPRSRHSTPHACGLRRCAMTDVCRTVGVCDVCARIFCFSNQLEMYM